MRISEGYSYLPNVTSRSAVPAPARQLLQANSGSQEGDSVGGVAVTAADSRENRVAELRQLVQEGKYQVDPQAVSSKIVDRHLEE